MSHPENIPKVKSELLVPAGSLVSLKTAFLYGADAVYAGTPDLSLRTKSSFSLEELIEGVNYAHSLNKKIYLTLNLFLHNKDVEKLPEYINTVKLVNPDGVIVADPGVFNYVRKLAPDLEIHISTQANICSWPTVNFWKEQGASLCVLAREVNFEELVEIRKKCPDIKLEVFIHGAMCMTYSGRCLLSNFMSERGANQGNCSHSCRWSYKMKIKLKDGTDSEITITDENKDLFDFFLEEEFRPGQLMPFEEDMDGSYILNSKDLCLMPKLDKYLELGVDSLKVEGRNKTQYYAGMVTRSYRQAIDDYYANPKEWDYKKYMKDINSVSNRGYTLAFHEGRLTDLAHNYESTKSTSFFEFAGYITDYGDDFMIFEAKNLLVKGDILEFISPFIEEPILFRIYEFVLANKEDKIVEKVHAGQKPQVKVSLDLFFTYDKETIKKLLPKHSLIRKVNYIPERDSLRIKLDREAQKLELSKDFDDIERLKEIKKKLVIAIEDDKKPHKTKLGLDGCCGKGCNGCLLFWYDEKYADAKEELLKKKQGELL